MSQIAVILSTNDDVDLETVADRIVLELGKSPNYSGKEVFMRVAFMSEEGALVNEEYPPLMLSGRYILSGG